jgi:glycosyltransferase involved in cell wall biosynthesis
LTVRRDTSSPQSAARQNIEEPPVTASRRVPHSAAPAVPRPHIIVTSNVEPARQALSGFSSRLYGFLSSLDEVGDVTLLAVRGNEGPELDAAGAPPVTWATVPGPTLSPSVAAWRWRRAASRWPAMCSLPERQLASAITPLQPDLVIVLLPYLAHVLGSLPRSLPAIVLLEEGWERLRPPPVGILRRMERLVDDRRVRRFYGGLGDRAITTVISEQEGLWFRRYGLDPVLLPHAVDTDYFGAAERVDADIDVAAFGDLTQDRNWRPLRDVVNESRRQAMPWRWGYVGNSGREVADLVREGDVRSGVVSDMRPYYARSKVVLVPADAGTGVKTTLLQAWASGVPTVVSRHSTTGLPVRHGENALVADTPAHAVALVDKLLRDDRLAREVGATGRQTVVARHSTIVVGHQLADLARRALSQPHPR